MEGFLNIDAFLKAPVEEVQKIAPATLILGAGGTRRRSELAGTPSTSLEYAVNTRNEMLACLDMIFRHGVSHVIAPLLIEGSSRETTPQYREKLANWCKWGLGSEDALEEYSSSGWQVRLLGGECWPEVGDLAAEMQANLPKSGGPTVWFSITSSPDLHWKLILEAVLKVKATTREAAIRAVYGEDIPPATLYLGTGKPDVVATAVPPLLMGDMNCYWRQHLGYDLDEETFRRVLYDYAFTRRTWRRDKTGRPHEALKYYTAWESPPTLGLGFRLGPFWYPDPLSLPSELAKEREEWMSRP